MSLHIRQNFEVATMVDIPEYVRTRIKGDLASRDKLHAEIRVDKIPTSNSLFLDAPFCRDNFVHDFQSVV